MRNLTSGIEAWAFWMLRRPLLHRKKEEGVVSSTTPVRTACKQGSVRPG